MWVVTICAIVWDSVFILLVVGCFARETGVGLAVVNLEASGKAIISGEWCLRRDVEGTWRDRGSEKGLVVMRLADGEDSYCEEKFRGLNVGALGGVL